MIRKFDNQETVLQSFGSRTYKTTWDLPSDVLDKKHKIRKNGKKIKEKISSCKCKR
jgi:hypothetical protein